jgi:hypothetical protein
MRRRVRLLVARLEQLPATLPSQRLVEPPLERPRVEVSGFQLGRKNGASEYLRPRHSGRCILRRNALKRGSAARLF